jgi:hypothetical protein
MADIDIGQITEALNDKTDRDMRNVDTTAKADAVIDYQEPTAGNGYTWYRKYASGWVEQGGLLGNAGSFTTRTITMPIAMLDANYTVVITGAWSDSSGNGSMLNQNKTTTTFGTYATNINNEGSWQVSGIAAN